MWKALVSSLGVAVDDPLLEQSVYQEVYERCVRDYFSSTNGAGMNAEDEDLDTTLSADEMNIIRYVGGYVARSLLKKHEKMTGDMHSQFIACLGEMAVEGEGEDVLAYTRQWFELVNRGGLYPINDVTFTLFANIEICVRSLLPKHVIKSNSDKLSKQMSTIGFLRMMKYNFTGHYYRRILPHQRMLKHSCKK